MRRWQRAVLTLSFLIFSACNGDQAKEMLETAQFEERQHNETHAKQLYQDIIRLYPSSKEADEARSRLNELSRKP